MATVRMMTPRLGTVDGGDIPSSSPLLPPHHVVHALPTWTVGNSSSEWDLLEDDLSDTAVDHSARAG
jgi:hypothetical protein